MRPARKKGNSRSNRPGMPPDSRIKGVIILIRPSAPPLQKRHSSTPFAPIRMRSHRVSHLSATQGTVPLAETTCHIFGL